MSQFDYQGMLNSTSNFGNDKEKEGKRKFPNISFVNLADLQGDGGIPNRQKLKRKKLIIQEIIISLMHLYF